MILNVMNRKALSSCFISIRAFSGKSAEQNAFQMPTPRSLGHGMKYRKNEINPIDGARPLAVVVGWMGAKDSQLKSYLSFYQARGFDTLSFAMGPLQVLFPDKAVKHVDNVLCKIVEVTNVDKTVGNVTQKKAPEIVYHSFSMGGYLFGLTLLAMAKDPKKYGQVERMIKAQIFDSTPDYNGIPAGLSKSMGGGPIVEKILENIAQGYLSLTYNTSGVLHRAASDALHNNYLPAPALLYYSNSDPIARWQDIALVASKWRAMGKYTETCTWQTSPHIQHARLFPERYFDTLDKFLVRCNLLTGENNSDKIKEAVTSIPKRQHSATNDDVQTEGVQMKL